MHSWFLVGHLRHCVNECMKNIALLFLEREREQRESESKSESESESENDPRARVTHVTPFRMYQNVLSFQNSAEFICSKSPNFFLLVLSC